MPTRSYRSDRRTEQARATRRSILAAASEAFLLRGFTGATLASIARAAGVSVPTVEAGFGTKAALLKAAIDVAIAGDDEPVAVLDRDWTSAADRAAGGTELIAVVAQVLAGAQERSAGLVCAAFDGAITQPELQPVADQLVRQRAITARWIIDELTARADLRPGWSPEAATETLWMLMDPVLYIRLVRDRARTTADYRSWWTAAASLLIDDRPAADRPTTPRST